MVRERDRVVARGHGHGAQRQVGRQQLRGAPVDFHAPARGGHVGQHQDGGDRGVRPQGDLVQAVGHELGHGQRRRGRGRRRVGRAVQADRAAHVDATGLDAVEERAQRGAATRGRRLPARHQARARQRRAVAVRHHVAGAQRLRLDVAAELRQRGQLPRVQFAVQDHQPRAQPRGQAAGRLVAVQAAADRLVARQLGRVVAAQRADAVGHPGVALLVLAQRPDAAVAGRCGEDRSAGAGRLGRARRRRDHQLRRLHELRLPVRSARHLQQSLFGMDNEAIDAQQVDTGQGQQHPGQAALPERCVARGEGQRARGRQQHDADAHEARLVQPPGGVHEYARRGLAAGRGQRLQAAAVGALEQRGAAAGQHQQADGAQRDRRDQGPARGHTLAPEAFEAARGQDRQRERGHHKDHRRHAELVEERRRLVQQLVEAEARGAERDQDGQHRDGRQRAPQAAPAARERAGGDGQPQDAEVVGVVVERHVAQVGGLAEARGRRQDERSGLGRIERPAGRVLQADAAAALRVLAARRDARVLPDRHQQHGADQEAQRDARREAAEPARAHGAGQRLLRGLERPDGPPQRHPTRHRQRVVRDLEVAAQQLQAGQQAQHADGARAGAVEHAQGPAHDPGQVHRRAQLRAVPVHAPRHDLREEQEQRRAQQQRGEGQLPPRQQPRHAQAAEDQVAQHPRQGRQPEGALQEAEQRSRRVQARHVGQGPECRHAGEQVRVPLRRFAARDGGVAHLREGVGVAGVGAAERQALEGGARVQHRDDQPHGQPQHEPPRPGPRLDGLPGGRAAAVAAARVRRVPSCVRHHHSRIRVAAAQTAAGHDPTRRPAGA